ncbi:MAG: helix-turn-helix domain-containing protein, partial [Halobacteria archaeon]|nr:helix-turn-helix domain-containing protein [Halobacteria archaeon]
EATPTTLGDAEPGFSHVESALERIESRQRIVEERNNKERMRSLLTSSSSRQEVEETVCEYLVEEEGYSLAWTGNVSENTPPKAFVRRNEEGDYLESVVFPVGSDREDGDPGVRTAATGEVSVKSLKPDGFSGERASAVEETDLSTGASIPLVEGDVMYGVLTVYSDEEDGIDEKDIETLEEFGKSLSSAIKSREMEEGLTTDQPMRLELETGEHPLLEAAEDWGSLTVDSVVPRDDDFLYHVDIDEGVEIPSVEEGEDEGSEDAKSEDGDTDTETDLPDNVEKAEVISESDQGVTARVVAPGPTPEAVIADHGGMVVRTEIDGSATVVSKVSRRVTGDVTDSVRSQFDDVRLTAKKSSSDEGSEPLSLDWRIQKLLNDELTKKQFDSLRTAYKNGYFERPRRTNTTETAELLDLSRPTFVQHLRAAERKILGNLID